MFELSRLRPLHYTSEASQKLESPSLSYQFFLAVTRTHPIRVHVAYMTQITPGPFKFKYTWRMICILRGDLLRM